MTKGKKHPPIIDAEYVDIPEHAFKKPKEEQFTRQIVTVCATLADRICDVIYFTMILCVVGAIFNFRDGTVFGMCFGFAIGRLFLKTSIREAFVKLR